MKKNYINLILILFSLLIIKQPVIAQTANVVSSDPVFLITELKVSPSNQEFIEFTNNSNQELELSSVSLQYHSDSSPSYSNKTLTPAKTFPVVMPAGSKLQISSSSSTWAPQSLATFSAGLKDSIGWIKLNVTVGSITSSVGANWGLKDEPDCTTSPVPDSSQSLKRFVDDSGLYLLSDKPGENFYVSSNPTTLDQEKEAVSDAEVVDYCNMPIPPEPEPTTPITPNPTSTTQPTVDLTSSQSGATYLPILISELLPDPVSPQTDTEDEYIELFNPNSETVNLGGYQLQSGNSYSYKYTFDSVEIPAGGYLVIYRRDSGLTLSNTSSSVRILDPAGTVLDETSYQDPEPGSSWSKIDGAWVYTSSLTPGLANVLTAVLPKAAKTSTKKASTKKATVKKASIKKASTKKTSTKTTKTSKDKKDSTTSFTGVQDDPDTKLKSKYIYIAIAVLLIYNLWEYRHSIKRFLLKPIAKKSHDSQFSSSNA